VYVDGKDVPIAPGITASVEVKADGRRVIQVFSVSGHKVCAGKIELEVLFLTWLRNRIIVFGLS